MLIFHSQTECLLGKLASLNMELEIKDVIGIRYRLYQLLFPVAIGITVLASKIFLGSQLILILR